MAVAADPRTLRDTEDFLVESPHGAIGLVEEVWLGERAEPRALAVRTRDGRHALLLDEDVLSVDREHRWIVVEAEPELRELDAPRLTNTADGQLVATWATTGSVVHRRRLPSVSVSAGAAVGERPLWQLIASLWIATGILVAGCIALVFLVAWLVAGAPY